jgi:hypothetical protein
VAGVVLVRRRVFFEGDFFWRLPLLLGPLFIVTSSCLLFGFVKVFWVFGRSGSSWAEPFPFDRFVVCTTAYHVICLTFCVLVSGGPVTFASRSGVGV